MAYKVQTKTVDDLRQYHSEAQDDAGWTSTGGAVTYNTAPFETLLEHYLNHHVPSTWTLVALSVEFSRVRMVWHSDDR